jgi:hypothetical protein
MDTTLLAKLKELAEDAVNEAEEAETYAGEAMDEAKEAEDAASEACDKAGNARASAKNARKAAEKATKAAQAIVELIEEYSFRETDAIRAEAKLKAILEILNDKVQDPPEELTTAEAAERSGANY